jgi:hypothetical protein
MMKFWGRKTRRGREDLHDEHQSVKPALDCIKPNIMSRLEKASLKPAYSIAEVLNVDRGTLLHRSHEKLGFKSGCLRWVDIC